jgi:hypothetical protein
VYPAIYYIVYPHARYRHPIEPEIMILVVFMFSEFRRRGSGEAGAERTPA